ncbi:MAG TPA: AAA family ATPase [Bryobacteraceae bacterium]|nr:AAA family ATPase [Bryobacteraceae bacterium]
MAAAKAVKLLDPTRMGAGAAELERSLRERIIGQEDAIRQIVGIYQTFLAGMSTAGRPVGSLLFLGPTGSGKTRTVEALAESLVGDARAVVKIDCAEFQHSHEIAKLIGSPPGYLGHRETHPLLSQDMLNQYHTETLKLSFVLFDEIEKANDALWNLLLGILDKATLTLGDNKRVDFSRAIIFLTSNLGAAEMNAILRPRLGFAHSVPAGQQLSDKLASVGTEAARRRFTPEFLNRIDRVVTFQPLGEPELQQILDLELRAVADRLQRATGAAIEVRLTSGARDLLLREGTDARYGARHLKRAIERRLVHPLANLLATGQVAAGDQVMVDADAAGLVFTKEPQESAGISIAAA